MQRATCTVRLSGDVGNTVRKEGVSPAEIVILRDIHGGPDAVVDIQPTNMDKSSHADERAKLVDIYGQRVVDRIFPGQYANLPVSLKDIETKAEGDEDEDDEVVEQAPADPMAALDEDDRALAELIQGTSKKGELYQLAKDNEVDLKPFKDTVEDIKAGMLASLFPSFRKDK